MDFMVDDEDDKGEKRSISELKKELRSLKAKAEAKDAVEGKGKKHEDETTEEPHGSKRKLCVTLRFEAAAFSTTRLMEGALCVMEGSLRRSLAGLHLVTTCLNACAWIKTHKARQTLANLSYLNVRNDTMFQLWLFRFVG